MKYTVKATYTRLVIVDIEAHDADKAFLLAKEMNVTQFDQIKDSGVLKLFEIELSDANFTDEQLAFMQAYQNSVAVADRVVVKKYMLARDRENFDGDEHPDYSNITDAHEVWYHAKKFFGQQLTKKFYTGEKSE